MIEMTAFLRRMVLVGFTCVVLPTGCVKRTETIIVRQDGSVEIRLEYTGDRKDMENGVPALVGAPGWEFEEEVTRNQKDEEKITRTSVATFATDQTLPAAYPVDDPEAADLIVQHPTTLVVEQRGDDTYYHYRRVYKSRSWAHIKDWKRILIEEPFAEGGDDVDKQKLVKNIVHFEAVKQLALARRALVSVEPALAQDEWLQVYQAVIAVEETIDTDEVLKLLESPQEQAEDGANSDPLAELADRLNGEFTGVIPSTLRDLGLRRRYIAAFEMAFERERRRFAITEEYQGQQWEIIVKMPGRIVGHNADEIEGSAVKWDFDGNRFFDRDHELLVSSKVSSPEGR